MKTTIIDILDKIANCEELPKKIKYADEVLEYDDYKIDYVDSDGDGLFNEYAWITELNDEVEILETTITMKADQSSTEATNKIKKLEEKTSEIRFAIQHLGIETVLSTYSSKINEIIEVINER